jgi:translocator protein
MHSDTRRVLATIASFLLVMVSNIAANALPINGITTREISDQFNVLVIPAGYVFSIWGLIYVLLGAFTTWQALPKNRQDPALRSLGYLPALSGVLNATWIVLWQYEVFALTVPVIVAFLVTLVAIHLRLWAHRDSLHGTSYWTVRAPWSVYTGWLTVATIANVAQTLSWLGFDGFGIAPSLLAVAVLATGMAIALTFVTRYRDVAYGLVIVWAYVGVAVKEQATPLVPVAALVFAALVGVYAAAAFARGRTAAGARRVGAPAAG